MEERGGGCAEGGQGRTGRARPHRAPGSWPSSPGRGVRGRGSAVAATAAREGERGTVGRGNRGGRGVATGEGEGRVREALYGRETKKQRNPRCNNGGFSPGKKTLAGAEDKSVDCQRFGGSDRRTECAPTKPLMRRTQRYPQIPQTMHRFGVIARRSCRRNWNRSELRRAIPGARDRIWRNHFVL
jgi:hypothetical protein